MTGEWTQNDVLERFAALTKVARLMRRRANADPADLMRIRDAFEAKERAIGYTTECIAQELHKIEPQIFRPELHARFKEVGDSIDRHVSSGPIGADKRRALIERVEAYVSSSAGVLRALEPADDETIAKALNVKASMVSYIFDREIGRQQHLAAVDRPFDGHDARRLNDSLGELHHEVDRRIVTNDYMFSKPAHDRVGFFPDQIERQLEEEYQIVHSRPPDLTLARVDQNLQAAAEAATRDDISDEFFLSSPENSPAASATTSPRGTSSRQRKHEEISSIDEGPWMGLPARRRRLSQPGQSSTSSIVLGPRSEAIDARDNLLVDGQAANLHQSDRPPLQGPDQGVGSIARSAPPSDSTNQRPSRERQRNRGGGLEY